MLEAHRVAPNGTHTVHVSHELKQIKKNGLPVLPISTVIV